MEANDCLLSGGASKYGTNFLHWISLYSICSCPFQALHNIEWSFQVMHAIKEDKHLANSWLVTEASLLSSQFPSQLIDSNTRTNESC